MTEKSVMNIKENKDLSKQNTSSFILTPEIVKKYICEKATEEEIYKFLMVCESQKLNPFLREIYLVKPPGKEAHIVTGKETFLKRAQRSPKFRGFEAGTEGELPNLIAWAKVYVKGYQVPVHVIVHYSEYVGNAWIWDKKPKTMLRKVALMQALREAFPDELGGLYDASEINSISDELSNEPINVDIPPLEPVRKDEPLRFEKGQYSGQLVSEVTDEDYLEVISKYEGEYKQPCIDRLVELDHLSDLEGDRVDALSG